MGAKVEQRIRAEGLDYGLLEAAPVACDWLREHAPAPARLRVVGDDDSDGVTSAHVLSTALRRAGYNVETALHPIHTEADLVRVFGGAYDAWLVADAGSAFLPQIDNLGKPVLILDHHRTLDYKPRHVHELNPRRVGGIETWGVSASIVSVLFAAAWDARNWDLATAGIAGAISDRQHLGGFHGLTEYCIDGAERADVLEKSQGFTLEAPTVEQSLTQSIDPYFADFATTPQEAARWLTALRIDPSADPLKLGDAQAKTLADGLHDLLKTRGASAEHIFPFYGPRLHPKPSRGVRTLLGLSRLLEAVTASSAPALAFALLEGRPDAVEDAQIVARHRDHSIHTELRRLRDRVHETPRLRWAETADAPNTGVYSHVLLTYVFGDDRPLVIFSKTTHRLRASARGSPQLFLAGLDLSVAVPEAAARVGGSGGGHPGAAGASLPPDSRDEFLAALERVLAGLAQRRKHA